MVFNLFLESGNVLGLSSTTRSLMVTYQTQTQTLILRMLSSGYKLAKTQFGLFLNN